MYRVLKSKAGGVDEGNPKKPPLYICRKKMNCGVHPGKFSYSNNLYDIPWGGKEWHYADGFEILLL